MKLTNAIIYRSMLGTELGADAAEAAMSTNIFVPTGPTQEHSSGWVPPRGEAHGALVEVIDGHWIMKLLIETRSVPGSAVRKRVDEMAAKIEDATGRKPGNRERKELKEEALRELLPRAFPKVAAVNVWLDQAANLIVVDTTSQSKADLVASALVQSIEGLALTMLRTAKDPRHAMAAWLFDAGAAPTDFTVDRDADLQALDESKAGIKYHNHPLDTDEVREAIGRGFLPTRLALTWDDRVSFALTEGFALRGLTFIDGTMSGTGDEPQADRFDADVAISTGECAMLIKALVAALGGEAQMTIAEASEGEPVATARAAIGRMEELAREQGHKTTLEHKGETLMTFGDGPDPLVEQARAVVLEKRKTSISLVQRHLKIGYNRAARLLETLEQRGVVSGMGADGTRKLLEVA